MGLRILYGEATGRQPTMGSQSERAHDLHRFSWQIFRFDRPKFASKNRMQGTPDENAATMQGSLAYFGTYSVDEAEMTITTIVEGSTFPNSEGEALKRVVTRITADTLVYENPSTTRGERVEAVWQRLR